MHTHQIFQYILLYFICSYQPVLAESPSSERPRVGTREFSGEAFNQAQRGTMTIRLQDELVRLNVFDIVEQADMDNIAAEHGLAQSGCTSMSCAIEMGRLAQVQQLLLPAVTRVGLVTSLHVRLVDIASGSIVKAVSLDSRKDFDAIVRKEIPVLARKIAGDSDLRQAVYGFDPTKTRKPIAVLTITAFGIGNNEAAGLTSRLRSELFNTGVYDVMEREQMEEILREQGFQQTGACSQENCLVQAGQLIGVQYMAGGAVSCIGNLYSVSSRLIDVETGKIVRSATADVKGGLERVLKESMNDMARALSGLTPVHRVNYPTLAWIGAATLCAGAAGACALYGAANYEHYSDEQIDIDKLRKYKQAAKTGFYAAYGCATAAGLSISASIYTTISHKIRLRVE